MVAEEEIIETLRSLHEAMMVGNLDEVMDFFAEDAKLVTSEGTFEGGKISENTGNGWMINFRR